MLPGAEFDHVGRFVLLPAHAKKGSEEGAETARGKAGERLVRSDSQSLHAENRRQDSQEERTRSSS